MCAATRCEAAKTGRCRCRCGGLLHGAARGTEKEFFDALPETDPHHAMAKPRAMAKRVPRKRVRQLPLFDEAAS